MIPKPSTTLWISKKGTFLPRISSVFFSIPNTYIHASGASLLYTLLCIFSALFFFLTFAKSLLETEGFYKSVFFSIRISPVLKPEPFHPGWCLTNVVLACAPPARQQPDEPSPRQSVPRAAEVAEFRRSQLQEASSTEVTAAEKLGSPVFFL